MFDNDRRVVQAQGDISSLSLMLKDLAEECGHSGQLRQSMDLARKHINRMAQLVAADIQPSAGHSHASLSVSAGNSSKGVHSPASAVSPPLPCTRAVVSKDADDAEETLASETCDFIGENGTLARGDVASQVMRLLDDDDSASEPEGDTKRRVEVSTPANTGYSDEERKSVDPLGRE